MRVETRPNPRFPLGKIDSSVALCLCDDSPSQPIVYCSEGFEFLTGYTAKEIVGRNCRFLQDPSGHGVRVQEVEKAANHGARSKLREKFGKSEEAQVKLVNYRKGGEKFVNLLTTIPLSWEEGNGTGALGRYIIGFQVELA